MKLTPTIKSNVIYVIALLYIVLFTYAAVSKILDFENFQVQLGQSPLLSVYATTVAVVVPTIEIVIAILLMFPKYRLGAIYASSFLMFLFTIYIVMILHFTTFVPCSCGGVLEKLSWNDHLIFNLVFVLLGITAILIEKTIKHTLIVTLVGSIVGILFMTLLFLTSEHIIQKENPFIRRFPQGTAARVAGIDLRNTSYYIAGATTGKVYLAHPEAPLQVFEYDANLKNKKTHTITLEREDYPFKALQLKIVSPYFYIYDKTVPVIYSGLVTDWKARIINDKKFGFNEIVFINPKQLILRTQKPNTFDNVLATVSLEDNLKVNYYTDLLEKQTDGIFDTDGTLQYSYELDKLIYAYYYRNQYIVTNKQLHLEKRGTTIDTTTKAKLKIVKVEKSNTTKLAAPPFMVNKLTAVTHNLLFVNSMLRGRFESVNVWRNATVVDVYDITNQHYLLSFYVYDEETFRMKDFIATEESLYIISGHFLLQYGFGERLTSRLKN